jgi:hypothetical protein
MGILVLVAGSDFLAVREEDEQHVERIGMTVALQLTRSQTDARALGFEHGECTTLAIEQRVVGSAAAIERIS